MEAYLKRINLQDFVNIAEFCVNTLCILSLLRPFVKIIEFYVNATERVLSRVKGCPLNAYSSAACSMAYFMLAELQSVRSIAKVSRGIHKSN
jgi:hypothetical protein